MGIRMTLQIEIKTTGPTIVTFSEELEINADIWKKKLAGDDVVLQLESLIGLIKEARSAQEANHTVKPSPLPIVTHVDTLPVDSDGEFILSEDDEPSESDSYEVIPTNNITTVSPPVTSKCTIAAKFPIKEEAPLRNELMPTRVKSPPHPVDPDQRPTQSTSPSTSSTSESFDELPTHTKQIERMGSNRGMRGGWNNRTNGNRGRPKKYTKSEKLEEFCSKKDTYLVENIGQFEIAKKM